MASAATKKKGITGAAPSPIPFEHKDLPITVSSGMDRYAQIEHALNALELGIFRDAAILVDAMGRDDRIKGVTTARVNGLLGVPLTFRAIDGRRRSRKAVEMLNGTDDKAGAWSRMFPPEVIGPLLLWGRFIGIGLAELLWEDRDSDVWTPRIKLWHPQFVQWDWMRRGYRVITESGVIDLPRTDRQIHSDGHWLIYTPYGYQYGWMQGLVRCLGRLYMGRGWGYRDWFRQSEKHGQPIDKAIVPSNSDAAKKRAFFSQVANRGSDTAVLLERDENGRGFDLEIAEATGRTWEVFKELLDRVNTDIAVAVLGQNLTTEVQSGSLAAAKVSDRVRSDFLRSDAETLSATLHAQVLHWWALYNFGDPGLAPLPVYEIDPPEDDVQDATTLLTIGQALNSFLDAGAPVDQREVLERYNVPQREVDDEASNGTGEPPSADEVFPPEDEETDPAITPMIDESESGKPTKGPELTPSATVAIITVNEARATLGLAPLTDGTGDMTIAEFQARKMTQAEEQLVVADADDPTRPTDPETPDNPARPASPTKPTDPEKPGVVTKIVQRDGAWYVLSRDGSKLLGGPYKTEQEAINRLRQVEHYKTLALAARPDELPSRRYADRLAVQSARRAAAVVEPTLRVILRAVRAAKTPADLKKRLERIASGLDPSRLARVFERAQIMAELAGRLDVLGEL